MMANSATQPNKPDCLEKLNYEDLQATKGRGKGGGKGMSFHNVSLNGRQFNFLLLPFGKYTSVPWRPSVCQGDGTEKRVSIQFRITENQRAILEHIEEIIRDQLEVPASMWNSSASPDTDGGTLKCKVNIQGPKACQVSGITDQMPTRWPQNCNGYIKLSSVYQQSRAAGLLYEVVALEVGPPPIDAAPNNPFLR